ncbi:hypothetical protein M501DRAFT_998312 [Patellaria atrata CBS 101060]|uniref:Uncharacterized protein n=1 Tax=Patellaria atrata CBS 101060 TaxID=1346257 RepID=A0A9P4SFR6_9PEZI|nr:hypothetical protein M501DRAFT_998312 [Patellaria atrata CBS 101060]
MQTFLAQQELTAQTWPSAQSALVAQSDSTPQDVLPSIQKPVLSAVEAQMQGAPEAQKLKLPQLEASQAAEAQTPLVQVPLEH